MCRQLHTIVIWLIVAVCAAPPLPAHNRAHHASHHFLSLDRAEIRAENFDLLSNPNDPEFIYQGYYIDIGVTAMWARGMTGLASAHPITIAVIDTGAPLSHPDVIGNLVTGFDFINMTTNTTQDESGDSHGSMVVGVIGGTINNGIGVAGLAGGDTLSGTTGVRIMPLRVATDTVIGVSCLDSVQAIDYARTHHADIINISYGSSLFCQEEFDAIQRAYDAGLAIVAGAGNDGSSASFYPAAYGSDTNENLVIAVAGMYADGTKADESNFGPWVDVSAPFRLIRSTTKTKGYDSSSGTSFSTPFVSGLLGLLMSNQGWSRDQAIAMLLASADRMDLVNPSYRGLLGAGRINADRASNTWNPVYLPNLSK